MMSARSVAQLVLMCSAASLGAACSNTWDRNGGTSPRADKPGSASTSVVRYPEPRFPSYLKPPKSIAELMPQARVLVRNKSGFQGKGMGIAQAGETIALVPTVDADDLVMQALKKALEERGVQANIVRDYELVKVTREQALALRKIRRSYTSERGYMEAANWVDQQFPEPDKAKAWLKEQRPDLYDALFPKARDLSPEMKSIWEKLKRDSIGAGIRAYLTQHPEVRGIFWGKGGGTGLRRAVHPLENRFLGTLTNDNRWDLMSAVGAYPADVWQLAEEQTLEPLAYVDKLRATDPEGTDVSADVTEEMAMRWSKGAYQRGHLYMFPNQATGRFGYSVVSYPAFQQEWIPRSPLCLLEGVMAGTNGHGGFFPKWEVRFEKGRIVDVKGGGVYGGLLKQFLKYPKIDELTYPFHDRPGFWYLYEIAFGTHPKSFRHPGEMMEGSLGPERLKSGVIHWGLGLRLWHDPDAPTESKSWLDFTAKYNLPRDHNFHTHTYFTTYQVHLRNADKWVNLLDRGRLTSLDNPEVRALASRYGDPDQLLAEDWIPEIPGINARGQYADYAANPWPFVTGVVDKVMAGTYEHFFPARGTSTPAPAGSAPAAKVGGGGE